MKIVEVERTIVSVPFTRRQHRITAREVYNWNIIELCKVTSDTGHVGWGETVIHYTWRRVTDESVKRVRGKSPAEAVHDDSLGSGLQMAVHDLLGKILEVPVHRLLGSKVRDWVPIGWWSIDASPEDLAAEAADAEAAGYTSFKIKPRPWWDIVAQVAAIDKVVPRHFNLCLDANGTWQNPASAIPVIRKLDSYPIVAMYETPIPQGDVPGNRRVRQSISRPVAMHFGSPDYITCIREEVCDGFVIRAGRSTVMRQGTLSAEAQMPFWLQLVGNGLMAAWAGHLGAVLTHANWPAITCTNLYSHQLIKTPIDVSGGYHRVPGGPGLGVEVDEEAVEKFRVPDEELAPFVEKGELYDHPEPRLLNSIVYQDGSCVHMAFTRQGCDYFIGGHGPAWSEGVRLEITPDDGSKEWSDLFERARQNPVRDRWAQ